jgi:mRNA interferase HigB
VRVLGIEVLKKAIRGHRDLAAPIATWLSVAKDARWNSLNELRRTWRNTDCVKGQTIFNVKGNKYRLLATVNYQSQTIVVRAVLTHDEYSKMDLNQ